MLLGAVCGVLGGAWVRCVALARREIRALYGRRIRRKICCDAPFGAPKVQIALTLLCAALIASVEFPLGEPGCTRRSHATLIAPVALHSSSSGGSSSTIKAIVAASAGQRRRRAEASASSTTAPTASPTAAETQTQTSAPTRAYDGVSILAAPLNWVIHDLFTDSSLDRSPALHCTTFDRPPLVLAPQWWRQRKLPLGRSALPVDRPPLAPQARRAAAVASAEGTLRSERNAQGGVGAGDAKGGAGAGDAPGPGGARSVEVTSGGVEIKSTLLVFFLVKWLASCVSATLLLPRGVFLPVFALGAALGRLAAQCLTDWGGVATVVGGGYAVVGAAAMVSVFDLPLHFVRILLTI